MTAAALPETDEFDWEVAVIVTSLPEGNDDGAVYKPLLLMVPVAALPPCTPFTLQFSAGSGPDEDEATICSFVPIPMVVGLLQPVPSWPQTERPDSGEGVGVGVGIAEEGVLACPPPQPIKVNKRREKKKEVPSAFRIFMNPAPIILTRRRACPPERANENSTSLDAEFYQRWFNHRISPRNPTGSSRAYPISQPISSLNFSK
jgi:hypothetical protein